MSMQEPANHYRLGLKLGTYCDNADRPARIARAANCLRTKRVALWAMTQCCSTVMLVAKAL